MFILALVIPHSNACAVLYCHLWPVWLYHIFPHYHIPGTTFGKRLFDIKCVLVFSKLFIWNFWHFRRIQRDTIVNVRRYSRKVAVSLVRFEWNFNFLDRFSRNHQIRNFMKIRPVGAELFYEDGQTHGQRHEEANSCPPQFCERA